MVPISHKKETLEAGFSLIEALAALVVLTTALIPLISLSNMASNVSASIKNNLIAANLAQEGVEIIKNMRDTNWIVGLPFDTGLVTCGLATCEYRVEWNSTVPIALGANPSLKKDASSGLYNYSTGTDQIYRRKVTLTTISADQIRITSEVSWFERGRTVSGCPAGLKCIKIEGHIFNWQ